MSGTLRQGSALCRPDRGQIPATVSGKAESVGAALTPSLRNRTVPGLRALFVPFQTAQSVRQMLRRIVAASRLNKHLTPHTFRHTFATLLLEEDVDVRYIQNLLGHSSIATTQINTHVNPSKQRQILETKHPRRRI